jgi:hypothetical protein
MRDLSARIGTAVAALACAVGAGCGGKSAGHVNPDGGGVDAAPLPTATPGAWTWVDVPGMQCDDGSRLRAAPAPLITDRLAPTSTFRTFAIPGESHTLLGGVDTIMSGGLTAEAWLAAMLAGDPTWNSVGL